MKKWTLALLTSLLLVGCGGSSVQKTLGLEKEPIDEFTVVKRAPLTLPPNYQLTPPQPGVRRPQELDTRVQAEKAIIGEGAVTSDENLSPGESIFLQKSGGAVAPDNVREQIDQAAQSPAAEEDKGFLGDYNIFYDSKKEDEVLDPAAEAERLGKERAEKAEDALSQDDAKDVQEDEDLIEESE